MKLKLVLVVLSVMGVLFVGTVVNYFNQERLLHDKITELSESISKEIEEDNDDCKLTAGIETLLSMDEEWVREWRRRIM